MDQNLSKYKEQECNENLRKNLPSSVFKISQRLVVAVSVDEKEQNNYDQPQNKSRSYSYVILDTWFKLKKLDTCNGKQSDNHCQANFALTPMSVLPLEYERILTILPMPIVLVLE